MLYDKPLPLMQNLKRLTSRDDPFPVRSDHLVLRAEQYGFDENTLAFLKLFSHDEIFLSRSDFLERCRDLKILIRSKQEMPLEHLRGQQD